MRFGVTWQSQEGLDRSRRLGQEGTREVPPTMVSNHHRPRTLPRRATAMIRQ